MSNACAPKTNGFSFHTDLLHKTFTANYQIQPMKAKPQTKCELHCSWGYWFFFFFCKCCL